MKILIWIFGFLLMVVLNFLLVSFLGVGLGSLPVWLLLFYICSSMCKSWDKHKIARRAKKMGISSYEYIKSSVPGKVLIYFENSRGNESIIRAELKELKKERTITSAQADILLAEFMKPFSKLASQENSTPPCSASLEDAPGLKVLFCRKCGVKLPDNAQVCSRCGTKIITEEFIDEM